MNDEAVREKLAAALHAEMGCWADESCPWCIARAEALLPVVREIAAEELREAAGDAYRTASGCNVVEASDLRLRADALKHPDGPVR